MISVIRSGLSGITQEISVISNNIANANSIGFKKSTASFDDVFSEQSEKRSGSLTGFGISLKQPNRIHTQGSLKETIKAVAEELNVKPALINKAIRVAQKRDWSRVHDEFEDLETIVATTGYDKDV